ncbi:MAG: glycerol-3-phosphate 1-O-acyltransferase PlsY [Candidatus Omnitrophica bacterium]|nr:glycerol-3-phosphate 1-O-acyltransferase PlsY [Candidatus Omnitrophota bacterium]
MILFFLLFAYLLGSIPFGLFMGYAVKGVDVRKMGSKNMGATNVFRSIGKKWGILVFLLDALKGYSAVVLPRHFYPETQNTTVALGLACAAILGHTFPIWLRFKGGKGVATSLGVFMAVAAKPALITFLLWCLVFALSRILSVASLTAAYFFPLAIILFSKGDPGFGLLLSGAIALSALITFTHRTNIQRLFKREEKRLF